MQLALELACRLDATVGTILGELDEFASPIGDVIGTRNAERFYENRHVTFVRSSDNIFLHGSSYRWVVAVVSELLKRGLMRGILFRAGLACGLVVHFEQSNSTNLDTRSRNISIFGDGITSAVAAEKAGAGHATVPLSERISGPGASPIMAAFTHIGFKSRFTDGTYGVYYASNGFDGALKEVLYHKQQFLERTHEPRTQFDLRAYIGRIDSDLHDIRGGWPEAHTPTSYVSSQGLARTLRAAGANGIVYDSVRLPTAANIAVFRPPILASPTGTQHVIQGPHIRAEWDGTRMLRYIIMGELRWISL